MSDSNTAEWIEWSGGKCPVAPDTQVAVALRIREALGLKALHGPASNWNWRFNFDPGDIVAYRVVSS